jgi:hypothetical protein
MTKENFTSINVIIDRSGSMGSLAKDTIGSFNTFLAEQKLVPGDAVFTLCTFNHDYTLVHDFIELAFVPDLNPKTYAPSGNTALLDAMGTTINSVGQKLAAMVESERPSKIVFLIITDGQENASSRFSREQIASMVQHQKDTYNWEFVFMGANIDAIAESRSVGISAANTMQYDASAIGTRSLYKSASASLSNYRSSGSSQSGFFGTTPPVTPPVTTTTTTTTVTPVTQVPVPTKK